MEASRARVESLVEWAIAGAFILAIVAAGATALRQFRSDIPVMPVMIAREAPAAPVPAGIPARAVSVPLLLLPDGKSVHVGDTLAEIAARLGRQAEVGTQSIDRAAAGARLTRYYEHAGYQFVLVFDAPDRDAEHKVAAIYLR